MPYLRNYPQNRRISSPRRTRKVASEIEKMFFLKYSDDSSTPTLQSSIEWYRITRKSFCLLCEIQKKLTERIFSSLLTQNHITVWCGINNKLFSVQFFYLDAILGPYPSIIQVIIIEPGKPKLHLIVFSKLRFL